MPTLDIFNDDAFSAVSLTEATSRIPYVPGLLGSMGLFTVKPARTNTIAVERRNGVLRIIPTSERGAPLAQQAPDRRELRNFNTWRVAEGDRIHAHEIQGMRAFGSESELQTVAAEVNTRLATRMQNLEMTWENMRLGAVQGLVVDSDGSTLNNWFTSFGMGGAPTAVDFALNTATTDVRGKCTQVIRAVIRGAKSTPVLEVIGLCGDVFWDALVAHDHVRDTYLGQQEASELRGGVAFAQVRFGGITFINYRGTDDNTTIKIPDKQAKFFPRGPGFFDVAFSPLEALDFANTPGRPVYAMVVFDDKRRFWVDVEVYSYPLFMCLIPEALQLGTTP